MACGGLLMGAAGLVYGVAGGVFDIAEAAGASGAWATAADAGVGAALDVQSMLIGATGLGIDTFNAIAGGSDGHSTNSAPSPGPHARMERTQHCLLRLRADDLWYFLSLIASLTES